MLVCTCIELFCMGRFLYVCAYPINMVCTGVTATCKTISICPIALSAVGRKSLPHHETVPVPPARVREPRAFLPFCMRPRTLPAVPPRQLPAAWAGRRGLARGRLLVYVPLPRSRSARAGDLSRGGVGGGHVWILPGIVILAVGLPVVSAHAWGRAPP